VKVGDMIRFKASGFVAIIRKVRRQPVDRHAEPVKEAGCDDVIKIHVFGMPGRIRSQTYFLREKLDNISEVICESR
jgi:hypothetical protein